MIRSADELMRAEERVAYEQQLYRAHAESTRDQFYALCELFRERTGCSPEDLHRLVAERVERNSQQKKEAAP